MLNTITLQEEIRSAITASTRLLPTAIGGEKVKYEYTYSASTDAWRIDVIDSKQQIMLHRHRTHLGDATIAILRECGKIASNPEQHNTFNP